MMYFAEYVLKFTWYIKVKVSRNSSPGGELEPAAEQNQPELVLSRRMKSALSCILPPEL